MRSGNEVKHRNAFPGAPAGADPTVNLARTSQVVDPIYLTLVYQVIVKLEERGAQVMDSANERSRERSDVGRRVQLRDKYPSAYRKRCDAWHASRREQKALCPEK